MFRLFQIKGACRLNWFGDSFFGVGGIINFKYKNLVCVFRRNFLSDTKKFAVIHRIAVSQNEQDLLTDTEFNTSANARF